MNYVGYLKILGVSLVGGSIPYVTNEIVREVHTETKVERITEKSPESKFVSETKIVNTGIDFTDASAQTINSVVHVNTKVVQTTFQRDIFQEFFYGPGAGGREFKQFGSGSGSGVIVSADGYIVTNNHVIESASEIEVVLNDNSKYVAKVVGADPSTDIAVLKIEGKNFQAVNFGNSDDLKIGEWVLAVGNPFNLTSTVTAGIVSAKARNINLLSERSGQDIVPIESFIQTDAAVNPGNSGGALVNTKGELVGINTAIASQTGSYAGYSFAVPVNLVKKVMNDLIEFGIVQRGYLGVKISDVSQELMEKNKLKDLKGVYVAEVVDGGSADKAGIKNGDVILKIGTKEVNSVANLQEEIGKKRPGDKIEVLVRQKDGDEVIKELVLRNKEGETSLISKEEIKRNVALGATFIELTEKEKKELNISSGVKISAITAGKLKSLGLGVGTVITKINNETIETVDQLTSKLNGNNRGVLLEIINTSGRKDYVGFGL
jgi:Do/DeqQ family serine protease